MVTRNKISHFRNNNRNNFVICENLILSQTILKHIQIFVDPAVSGFICLFFFITNSKKVNHLDISKPR